MYFQAKGKMKEEIRFDHLPSADWDETCLSKGVWTVGFSWFQDIVLTLKDKLSIRAIEYFALVLEQQYSITKLLLLHEDELIQKVKETTQMYYWLLSLWVHFENVHSFLYLHSVSSSGGAKKRFPWLQVSVQGVFHPKRPYGPSAGWPLCLWVLVFTGQRSYLSNSQHYLVTVSISVNLKNFFLSILNQ